MIRELKGLIFETYKEERVGVQEDDYGVSIKIWLKEGELGTSVIEPSPGVVESELNEIDTGRQKGRRSRGVE